MAKPKPTHYEILGVKPNAKHTDIGLAYSRQMSARRRENAPPDLKGEALVREAHAVLSDLDRRAAYDRELAAARLKPAFGAKQGVLAAIAIVLVAGGIYYFTVKRPADLVAQPVGRPAAEIAAAATSAVGRLQAIDMSGQSRTAGLAFAIEPGVMVASCHGISPGAQLAVNLNPRMAPARVTMTDEALGLCRLEVEGAGSAPLVVSGVEARAGDVVYATAVNAVGEVVLTEGRVKRVAPAAHGRIVEASVAPSAAMGAPLLDVHGRVIAVATQAGGEARHVAIPSAWTEDARPASAATPAAPAAAEPVPEAPAPSAKPAPAMPNAPGSFTPERVEKLHKAFRPPPNIPQDQDP